MSKRHIKKKRYENYFKNTPDGSVSVSVDFPKTRDELEKKMTFSIKNDNFTIFSVVLTPTSP